MVHIHFADIMGQHCKYYIPLKNNSYNYITMNDGNYKFDNFFKGQITVTIFERMIFQKNTIFERG